jgi:hypothetical protein
MLKSASGQTGLIALANEVAPGLLVSTSGMGGGRLPDEVARASDFLLIHFNNTQLDRYPERIAALQKHGKPIVCNEDEKVGADGAKAAELCVADGAGVPADARSKTGTGAQLIAFIPSLDLVLVRMTGSSGGDSTRPSTCARPARTFCRNRGTHPTRCKFALVPFVSAQFQPHIAL